MKIHNCAQGELEWTRLRLGRPTASEFDALLTPFFAPRTGEGVFTYLCKKLVEKWQGHALPGFSSYATEQGSILEEEALPWYAFEYGCEPSRPGFIESEDGRCGCSPDGLVGEEYGIEIKCPLAETHTGYLLGQTLPKAYAAQVYGSLFVTGLPEWRFISYRRGFKKLVVIVKRDEEIMERIGEALASFYKRFDDAMQQMKELK